MNLNDIYTTYKTVRQDREYLNGGTKAALSEEQVDSFFVAGNAKPPKKIVNERDALIAHLRRENWVRWRRFQKDAKWVKKKMQKMGLNPEDARWLI